MNNPFASLFKAKRRCPQCGTMLRFPANKGTLRVTCPQCKARFVVEFYRSMPFVWLRGKSIPENLKANAAHVKELWKRSPATVILLLAILIMLIVLIVRFVTGIPHAAPARNFI